MMLELRSEVEAAINKLAEQADSAEGIARFLEAEGLVAHVRCGRRCAISEWILQHVNIPDWVEIATTTRYVGVHDKTALFDADEEYVICMIDLPWQLTAFIRDFDNGWYPALMDADQSWRDQAHNICACQLT